VLYGKKSRVVSRAIINHYFGGKDGLYESHHEKPYFREFFEIYPKNVIKRKTNRLT